LGPSSTRFTLLQAFLSRGEGLPGHANNPNDSVRLHTARSLTAASLDLRRGLSRIEARTWVLLRGDTYDDREGQLGIGNQHNEDAFGSGGGLLHWQRAFGEQVVGGLTLAARQDRFETTDLLTDQTSQSARRLAFTPAVDADVLFWRGRVTVSPVLQAQILDNRSLGQVPFSNTPIAPEANDTLFAPTPRLGLLVRPIDPVALKANVGTYVRPPDFTELFGDRGAIIGNTDLKPERGTQWDVGTRLLAPESWPVQGSVEVGHYWSSVEDLIVMVQNSQRTSVPVNLDKGWIQGVEAAVSLQAAFLELQSNLTRNTSVNLSSERQYANNQLPRIPTLELYQRTAVVWSDWVRLGHTWSFTDGNYWDRTNYYLAAPRAFHGAFVRVSPGGWWPSIELDALNLTDRIVEVTPRNPLDPSDNSRVVQPTTDFVGYPLPGRTLLVTVRWEHVPTDP
jgi:iron complex outermembrane receptor protein